MGKATGQLLITARNVMTKPHASGIQPYLKMTTPLVGALAIAISAVMVPHSAFAQAKRAKKKGDDKPKFEDVTLTTKDGVFLRCSYYPGADTKTTVPIMVLHGWGSSRSELHPFALYLQSLKHAVLVPDLRGHGRSTQQRNPRPGEPDLEIKADKMRRPEIERMGLDVEACKQFLMEKNNAGELNIEQLGVVGFEFGALLAVNWAAVDWSVRSLPAYKMGQDVKALALISPPRKFQGITTQKALNQPDVRARLSVLIVAGADDAGAIGDAKRMYNGLERFHTNKNERDLIPYWPETSLQGVQLLNARGFNVPRTIAIFINERLVKKAELFTWSDRTGPLD
jgi:pimeloyl-ACP methyl ester carboxylesterase